MGGGTQCGGAARAARDDEKIPHAPIFPTAKLNDNSSPSRIRIIITSGFRFFFGAADGSMQCSKDSVRDRQFAAVAFPFSMDLIERIARIATPPTPAHSVASFVGVGTI